MLQYLINLTGIWLVSLVVFDLFLRRESYHTYNRIYLLTTMLAGVIFPLIKWQPDTGRLSTALAVPVTGIAAAKVNIVTAAEPTTLNWEQWLLIAYTLGAVAMAGLLIRDIVKLTGYYRAGKKSAIKGWTLVETGKDHAPFSFLNLLFVSSRADYSSDEWQMLVEHEGRHTRLLHVVDLVVLQLGRIALWFHPLVYAYNKRLLMVHEYQADKVAAQNGAQVYGRFLAEQAILHAAPSITHSFNRSPIKKRILMLSKRSTTIARTKMVMVMPLTMACLVLFSQISYSKRFDRQGNKVTYRGNTFEYGTPGLDTVILINPVTGGEETKIAKRDGLPEKMNGKKIYQTCDLTQHPQPFIKNGTIQDYLFMRLSDMLNQLPNGTYDLAINNIVIDENGKIAYYDGVGFRQYGDKVSPKMSEAITDKIDEVLHNAPAMQPGKVDGKKVPSLYRPYFVKYQVEVYNHVSSFKGTLKE